MKHAATAALFAGVVTSNASTRVDQMSPAEIWQVASELRRGYGPRAKRIALREAVRAKWNDQPLQAQDWLAVASRITVVASLQ
jgi:hypothetical protein